MKIIESPDQSTLQMLKERKVDFNAIVERMQPVVLEVKNKGDSAIKKYAREFDKRELERLDVSIEKIETAQSEVSSALKEALEIAIQNITKFHAEQLPREWWIDILPGIEAGQLVRPLESVGCYIPGGRYPLVSTVLMTVLPAKIAGVKKIIVCTPKPSPEILYACSLCGADQVFEVGGAAAISAMAYGTETIPKVDKIVGPGNLYVSAAKKIVYGDVGIDFIAGPSEVVIIGDENANPYYIAADLIAQAEHDPASMALFMTPSKKLALEVRDVLEKMLENLATVETAKASLETKGAILVIGSLDEAFAVSNFFAPEHLEIHVDDPEAWLDHVQNAGSIFLGPYAPESAGDYASGTNHVLPTGGFAASQSGLSVKDFVKTPTVQRLSKEGLGQIAPVIIALAEAEGLVGHAESIKVRMTC